MLIPLKVTSISFCGVAEIVIYLWHQTTIGARINDLLRGTTYPYYAVRFSPCVLDIKAAYTILNDLREAYLDHLKHLSVSIIMQKPRAGSG